VLDNWAATAGESKVNRHRQRSLGTLKIEYEDEYESFLLR
jgi:hypothetical protein